MSETSTGIQAPLKHKDLAPNGDEKTPIGQEKLPQAEEITRAGSIYRSSSTRLRFSCADPSHSSVQLTLGASTGWHSG
jgi:hypothetical protein